MLNIRLSAVLYVVGLGLLLLWKTTPAEALVKNFVNSSTPTPRPTFVVNFDMATVICQHSADPLDLHLHDINILCNGKKDCFDNPGMHDEIFPYCEGSCSPECSKHGACLHDGENTQCYCKSGYHGQACELLDANECSDKPCHWLAHCWNTYGSYKCQCFPGFNGDGYQCVDNNECATGIAKCPEHSECVNLPGTYLCNCSTGYMPKGLPLKKCEDIDECAQGIDGCALKKSPSGKPLKCQNKAGSFECVEKCDAGFVDQNGICEDIDDCALSPCHKRAHCTNLTPPSTFDCQCEDGLEGNGIDTCKPTVDCVKEPNVCDALAFCRKDMKTCVCQSGYSGDGISCYDVDECNEPTACNGTVDRCLNIDGSYLCCDKYMSDAQCKEAKGATDCPNKCGANAQCVMGECKCNQGFEGSPLKKCTDVDECMDDVEVCSNMKEWCVNVDGGFHCCRDDSPSDECRGMAIETGPGGEVSIVTFGPPAGESTGLPLTSDMRNETDTGLPGKQSSVATSLPVIKASQAVTSTPVLFTQKPNENATETDDLESMSTVDHSLITSTDNGSNSAVAPESKLIPSPAKGNETNAPNVINAVASSVAERETTVVPARVETTDDTLLIANASISDEEKSQTSDRPQTDPLDPFSSTFADSTVDDIRHKATDDKGELKENENNTKTGDLVHGVTTASDNGTDAAETGKNETSDGSSTASVDQIITSDSSSTAASGETTAAYTDEGRVESSTNVQQKSSRTTTNVVGMINTTESEVEELATTTDSLQADTKPDPTKKMDTTVAGSQGGKGGSSENNTTTSSSAKSEETTPKSTFGIDQTTEYPDETTTGDEGELGIEIGGGGNAGSTSGDQKKTDNTTPTGTLQQSTAPDDGSATTGSDKTSVDSKTSAATTNSNDKTTDGQPEDLNGTSGDRASVGTTSGATETDDQGTSVALLKETVTASAKPDAEQTTDPDSGELGIGIEIGSKSNTTDSEGGSTSDESSTIATTLVGGVTDAGELHNKTEDVGTENNANTPTTTPTSGNKSGTTGDPINTTGDSTHSGELEQTTEVMPAASTSTTDVSSKEETATKGNKSDSKEETESGDRATSKPEGKSSTETDSAEKETATVTETPVVVKPNTEPTDDKGTTPDDSSDSSETNTANDTPATVLPETGIETTEGNLPVESKTKSATVDGRTLAPTAEGTTVAVVSGETTTTTSTTDEELGLEIGTPPRNGCRSNNDCGADSFCERRSGVCRCEPGFSRNNPDEPCTDVDECTRGSEKCDLSATCINIIGGYDCRCDVGFRKLKGVCVDIDECLEKRHRCDSIATCVNTRGSYKCDCPNGYIADGSYNCLSVGERVCSGDERRKSTCVENSVCVVKSDDIVECSKRCTIGYQMSVDGKCQDIDECSVNDRICAPKAKCVNNNGGYSCECLPGFAGDGHICDDIDECLIGPIGAIAECHPQATCVNVVGSFSCDCPSGWLGDGRSGGCYDTVNPRCADVSVACGADEGVSCITTETAAVCQCSDGYRWNPVAKQCRDINECAENRHRCDRQTQECLNSEGSYTCRCRKGFTQNNIAGCLDIDECVDGKVHCDENAICRNVPGSYECKCKPGYRGNGRICSRITEEKPCSDERTVKCRLENKECVLEANGDQICGGCLRGFDPNGDKCQPSTKAKVCSDPAVANDCDRNADCVDVAPGRHFCVCKTGFIGDGFHCDDVNECRLAPDTCGSAADCVNTVGSYVCVCPSHLLKRIATDGTILCERSALCPEGGTPDAGSKPCLPDSSEENGGCSKGYFCKNALCCPIPETNNCFFNKKLCHADAKCFDGLCQCNPGYDGDGMTCTERSICNERCHKNAVCLPDATCHCWGNGDALTTCELDPLDCVIDPDICHPGLGQCRHNRRRCFCKPGSYGNGRYCTKDEADCSARPEICSEDANCRETRCICKSGFIGDGKTCISTEPSSPCADCHPNALCLSDKCVCKTGFQGDGKTCELEEVISPCTACHVNALCISDSCVCKQGYLGNGKTCVPDPNDCEVYPEICHTNAKCRIDIRRCTCKEGFSGDGKLCHLIDQGCAIDPKKCHKNAICKADNCVCPDGFNGDGVATCEASAVLRTTDTETQPPTTIDLSTTTTTTAAATNATTVGETEETTIKRILNPCKTTRTNCHKNAICRNDDDVSAGYRCVCDSGFHGDGTDCQDVNECETLIAHCHPNARCVNTVGSFACVCKPGFRGDGSRNCAKSDEPLKVSVQCEPDGIVLTLTKEDFTGRMYVKEQSENKHCSQDFNVSTSGEYKFKVKFDHCDMTREGVDTFLTTVVVQKHRLFVTASADAYDLRCTYPAGMKMVMSHFNVSMLTTVNSLLKQGPEGMCSLSVIDPDTEQPVEESTVGENIRLKVIATPTDIFSVGARNCYAVNMEDGQRYKLTDEFGCAVDTDIFPDWQRDLSHPSEIRADFRSFKWPESSRVRFQCDCSACIESCRWVDCRNRRVNAFRRRHRYRYYQRRFFARAKRMAVQEFSEVRRDDVDAVATNKIYSTVIVVREGSEERQAEDARDTWLLADDPYVRMFDQSPASSEVEQQCVSTALLSLAVSVALCCLVAIATAVFWLRQQGK